MAITIRASNGIIEFFLATAQTNHTIDLSDAAIGDVRLIMVNLSPDGTGTVPIDPTISGWIQLHPSGVTGAASDGRISSFYREVVGGDTLTSATLAITSSETCMVGSYAVTLEGVDTAQILDQTSPAVNIANGTPNCPTIDTQTNGAFVGHVMIIDATPGLTDDDIPSVDTLIGTQTNNPPSNGMNLGVSYNIQATAGDDGAQAYTGISEEYVAATFAIRPTTIGLQSVTPNEFDMDNIDIDLDGSNFEASQASGKVWMSDVDTLAGGINEVDISSAITVWGDALVTLDLTDLSDSELLDLHTLGPGARFMIIVNDSADEYSKPVTLHRPKEIVLAASSNITASGEDTTFQMAAPATKSTGDFGGGRIQDDENPGDTVDLALDEYREDEWNFQVIERVAEDVGFEFRVLVEGISPGTETVVPELIVGPSVTTEQEGFQFRDDDDDEINATDLGAQDNNLTRETETNTRLRMLTDTTENEPEAAQATLQYRRKGDANSEWRDI